MATSVAESALALVDPDEERAAHHPPKLDALTGVEAERIARVAYRISQVASERDRRILPAGTVVRPWRSFSARERSEAVATVTRVVQALVLLGWLEPPDAV